MQSHVLDFAAETVCDLHYVQTLREDANSVTVADGRLVLRLALTVRHANADTGYALTERGTVTYHVDPDAGPQDDTGVYWHLRDPDGKLVVIHAGRVVWYLETFEPISRTPNQEPSFSGVICPALGGAPA